MFTKGVVACVLGGALVGATLPEGPFVVDAQARKVAVKKSEKVSHPRRGIEKAAAARRPDEKRASRLRRQPRLHAKGKSARGPNRITPARLGAFAVTAYTHHRTPRGGLSKTATGAWPRVGRTVAVDPRVIPLGSRIYIAGVGERIAEDTGRKIKGKKLDLFLPSVRECRRFGVRRHEVRLVTD